jgi:RNA polymerase sigma factor (sigma-70 family)
MERYKPVYRLIIKDEKSVKKYYVAFHGVPGAGVVKEVSADEFAVFNEMQNLERRLFYFDHMHTDFFIKPDDPEYAEFFVAADCIEDEVIRRERDCYLYQVIQRLSPVSRRRFLLYHIYGMTYRQIADVENCSHISVYESVKRAEKEVRERMLGY